MKKTKTQDLGDPVTYDDSNSVTVNLNTKIFNELFNGKRDFISIPINQHTYDSFLDNIQGHLILSCEEMPDHFFSCYFWNKGEFPYVLKKDLKHIIAFNAGRKLLLHIIGHSATCDQRYTIQDDGTLIPDPNGEACVWTLIFDVKVDPMSFYRPGDTEAYYPKTYLLRWNPTISSFRLDDYHDATTLYPDGFCFNWSVYEWEDAHEGDRFYMLRTGDEKAGLVFRGVFTSEPYTGDDWAGKGKQRHYMEMECYDYVPAEHQPPIDTELLEKTITDINWEHGHSGELLSEEDAERLDLLWCEIMEYPQGIGNKIDGTPSVK